MFFFFFWPLPLNCGVAAADTILLRPVLSRTSYFVVPMALMSRLTQSNHLCFGLPSFLLPGGRPTISCVFLTTYSISWSRIFTCPNRPNFAFLHLSVIFYTFSLSLMSVCVTWSLSVWPHAHLNICNRLVIGSCSSQQIRVCVDINPQ